MKTEMKDRIRSRRVQLDITQQTLAKRLGVSRVSVTKWESGTTKPDGENLHQLAMALQTTPEWILYGQGEETQDDTKVVPFLKPQRQYLLSPLFRLVCGLILMHAQGFLM
jgi:transcriptional regulator with XRE-family HTH domain